MGNWRDWPAAFAALLAQRESSRATACCCGQRTARSGSPRFMAACCAGLAVPLDANGTADFAARVCADVAPRLAVGDGLLLHQLPVDSLWFAFPHLSLKIGSPICPPKRPVRFPGSRARPRSRFCSPPAPPAIPGHCADHGNVLASVGPIARHRSAICATNA